MELIDSFTKTLELEAQALLAARQKVNKDSIDKLIAIFKVLKGSGGALFFSGVGKSGIIGQKIASTFTSLGQKSFFIHPVEALHGDLGQIEKNDAICWISKSGTTEEILKLIPFAKARMDMTIGLLGNKNSPIGEKCGVVFDCGVEKEACINNLAPTTSSTLALAMGDAMAVCYEAFVNLSPEMYAVNHPGGLLGKSLTLKVCDLLVTTDQCARLSVGSSLREVIVEMTKYNLGGCAIIDNKGGLLGLMVEGDIRRALTQKDQSLESSIDQIMTRNPITISEKAMAYEALEMMENGKRSVGILPVLDNEKFIGFITLHDILQQGFSRTKKT